MCFVPGISGSRRTMLSKTPFGRYFITQSNSRWGVERGLVGWKLPDESAGVSELCPSVTPSDPPKPPRHLPCPPFPPSPPLAVLGTCCSHPRYLLWLQESCAGLLRPRPTLFRHRGGPARTTVDKAWHTTVGKAWQHTVALRSRLCRARPGRQAAAGHCTARRSARMWRSCFSLSGTAVQPDPQLRESLRPIARPTRAWPWRRASTVLADASAVAASAAAPRFLSWT